MPPSVTPVLYSQHQTKTTAAIVWYPLVRILQPSPTVPNRCLQQSLFLFPNPTSSTYHLDKRQPASTEIASEYTPLVQHPRSRIPVLFREPHAKRLREAQRAKLYRARRPLSQQDGLLPRSLPNLSDTCRLHPAGPGSTQPLPPLAPDNASDLQLGLGHLPSLFFVPLAPPLLPSQHQPAFSPKLARLYMTIKPAADVFRIS